MISALDLILPKSRLKRALVPWQSLLRDWWREDAQVLIYIAKVVGACLLALWISLKFELEQPRTAMLTVAIVMQSRTGMVFAKSFYRLIGTIVGITASFVLVALFAQERVLFLSAMAIWIGFCTAGSMVFRNHQSYGFVLAGYTICIVGLPATITPELTFDIGMTRISEIMVGLVAATIVSDLIFPQRMWNMLLATVRRRFKDFSDLLASMPDSMSRQDHGAGAAALRFAGDVFDVENFRASTALENDASRAHRQRLSLLNAEFMAVSTSFHALEQLLRRQQRSSHPAVVHAIALAYKPLAAALQYDGRSVRTEVEAGAVLQGVRNAKASLPQRLAALRLELQEALSEDERLDFETGAELLQRFADELVAYAGTYAALTQQGHALDIKEAEEPPPSLGLHIDSWAVSLAGLRGALALGAMTCLWIFADWRSGIEAITLGVITSTLFATSPSPERTIRQFSLGALIGTVLLYIANFKLLPYAQGFTMLSLALIPGLAIAAWLTTRPATALVGAGTFIIFLLHIGFNSAYSASPVAFLNDAIADFIAIGLAASMYALIDLSNGRWSHQRLAAALRKQVVSACRDALPQHRVRFESRARALMQRAKGGRRIADAQDKELVDWLLSTLETGCAVIELREEMQSMKDEEALDALERSLDRIAGLYAKPDSASRVAALISIKETSALLNTIDMMFRIAPTQRRTILTILHALRSALLDDDSVLARKAPLPEVVHAA
ncbi:alanine--tRNA ligase [Novimethylophilus kurashikiensis]|uniref:Alanine--tRNA ligase n=1 Tax=Novimethylophilus kurashikiensis TaxID=1825523 RepID=A0A2R5F4I0_9PROT|nr:FUSC family protein [Novimethylophilus kurashikiensis]GBG13312.1 alanine--tRNA ligase [Novimethylophilus kurashikiensis]